METPQSSAPSKAQALGTLRRFVLLLRSNWISATGSIAAFLALLLFVTSYILQSGGIWSGPYVGIVTLLVLPAMLVLGVLLIPFGLLLYRRKLNRRLEDMADRPLYLARAVVGITILNFVAVGMVGYAGVDYMGTSKFCGVTCHSVMEPEWVTYQSSPHARVSCVACHVGPGANWFIKSKINGIHQLLGVLRGDHSRPVPAPIEDMRSTDETCGGCHWNEKYLGTKLVVRPRFLENRENTEITNIILIRRGGTGPDGKATGVHWHAHPGTEVEYVHTDDKRMVIPWMRVKYEDGTEKIFTTKDVSPDQPPEGKKRTMNCIDCHNRAAHGFERAPDAIDRAMADGLISKKLPFIRKRALEVLTQEWTRDNVDNGIRRNLQDLYSRDAALDQEQLTQLELASEHLAKVWKRNVYPRLNLDWDTYRALDNHHGCFRCHEGKHFDREGKTLEADCSACHVVLSNEEKQPSVLNTLQGKQR